MKKTLIGGVKKLKQNFNKIKKYLTKRRVTAISLFLRVIGMITFLTLVPVNSENANASDLTANTKLQLDVHNNVPIKLVTNKPEITVGESKYQEKVRKENEEKERIRLASQRTVVVRDLPRVEDVNFEDKRNLAKKAASTYGIDWKILEAVWQIESGKRWNTTVSSYAGAQGPMQFMPGTWRAYGVDGNGDGVKNVNIAEDALFGAANYLAANGASSGNIDKALFCYNHAQWYVDKVKNIANSIID